MGALFEIKGLVKKVCEVQTFSSGFEKRDLILTDDIGAVVKWPNIMCFSFKKERMHFLDGVTEGMRVKLVFAIDGREWNDGSGKTRYFTDLTGIKLEVLAGTDGKAVEPEVGTPIDPPEPPPEVAAADDDLPF